MARTSGPRVEVEARGAIRVLTLDNPTRRNALDAGLLEALREELGEATLQGVRGIVLRGEGEKSFCSGMDLGAVRDARGGLRAVEAIEQTMQAIEAGPPIVALINGAAYGAGCELACACDLRVARRGASLCLPPARLGLVYSAEGIARVASVAGPARARRMLLTAQPVDAAVALAWGLVDEVVPASKALPRALELASEIAENAPLALVGTKRVLALLSRPRIDRKEREEIAWLQKSAFSSEDAREAFEAFRSGRKPKFRGS